VKLDDKLEMTIDQRRHFQIKTGIKIVLILVAIVILVIGGGIFYITRGLESGKNLTINSIRPSHMVDGIYNGRYEAGRFSNEVNVTIGDGKITQIDVIHTVLAEKPELTSTLIQKVIETQSVDIDTVSGATVTTKAYLKSIEIALTK